MDGNATPRVRYRVTDLQSAVEFQGMGKAGGPGVIAEATEDGLPVIFRLVDELPSPEVRERLPWLAVISWRYDRTIRNGMPPEATNTQMIALEHAMDELEAAALSPAAGGRHSHRDVRGLGAAFGPGGLDPCRGLSGRHPAASGGMDVVSVEAPPLGMNVVERRLAA